MRKIPNPQPRKFTKMTRDMAVMLMKDMNIHETCPLALALDDEYSRTNLECLCNWLRQQAEQHDLEPRIENRDELILRLNSRLEVLFDKAFL